MASTLASEDGTPLSAVVSAQIQSSPHIDPGAAGALRNKPYMGADSFGVEDGLLFYGRDQEARELVARVLSSRLTVLHAPSGAGKTSLLNARLISDLEQRNWAAVRVRIDNDPMEAVRFALLQYLMPPPHAERLVLRLAIRQLRVPQTTTLHTLAEAFDRLQASDRRRRMLVAPVRSRLAPSRALLLKPFGAVSTMIGRFLSGNVDTEVLSEHFSAIVHLGAGDLDAALPPDWKLVSLRDIDRLLGSAGLETSYERALALLYPPVSGLRAFMQNIFRTYGAHRTDFYIVLILDQFEEMFTRFIDRGRLAAPREEELPDWRLRDAFFGELEELYDSALGESDGSRSSRRSAETPGTDSEPHDALPLRFVVSLREEYLGRLDQLRRFAPEVNSSTYRLGFLPITQAREAILQPAHEYGYTYDTECLDAIVDTLAREGFVEPFLLQIVCDSLWRKLRASLPFPRGGTPGVITKRDLINVFPSGVQGIVDAYFADLLGTLPADDAKADALDLMEMLITGVGTRNIIEESLLLHAPFRSEVRRRSVLDVLVDGKFLRRERRLGSFFVEITHECLIASVQEQIRRRAKDSRDLRQALRVLEGIRRGDVPWLDVNDFEVLDFNHARIEWPRWAVDLMVQSAATYGSREQMRRWFDAHEHARATLPVAFTTIPLSGEEGQRYLTLEEVRAIELSNAEHVAQLAGHEQRVFRSLLYGGLPEDGAAIKFWLQRM